MNRDRVADDTRVGYPARGESLDMASSTLTGKIFLRRPAAAKARWNPANKKPGLAGFPQPGPSDTPPKMIRVYTISVTLQKNEK
jgi:hypothetical protein